MWGLHSGTTIIQSLNTTVKLNIRRKVDITQVLTENGEFTRAEREIGNTYVDRNRQYTELTERGSIQVLRELGSTQLLSELGNIRVLMRGDTTLVLGQ